ncbi:MAG: hypothetical protein NVV63_02290 [Opitutus sp.]|nr:hypothetical protein [Opitutus sp.]
MRADLPRLAAASTASEPRILWRKDFGFARPGSGGRKHVLSSAEKRLKGVRLVVVGCGKHAHFERSERQQEAARRLRNPQVREAFFAGIRRRGFDVSALGDDSRRGEQLLPFLHEGLVANVILRLKV